MGTPQIDDAKIAEAAFYIWLEEGRPEGRDLDHWFRAAETLTKPAKPARKPRAKTVAKPAPKNAAKSTTTKTAAAKTTRTKAGTKTTAARKTRKTSEG